MHIVFAGPPGAGKTFLLARACANDRREVLSNVPMKFSDGTEASPWYEVEDWVNRVCICLAGDELHLWLDARHFQNTPPESIRWLTRHRHYDSIIYSTVQHLGQVDKAFRRLVDYVVVPRPVSIPFLGWFFRKARRPVMVCKYCNEIRDDSGMDMVGWRRWLGFGTVFVCDFYDAAAIGRSETAVADEKVEAMKLGSEVIFFDIDIANIYGSGFFDSKRDGLHEAAHRGEYKPVPPAVTLGLRENGQGG